MDEHSNKQGLITSLGTLVRRNTTKMMLAGAFALGGAVIESEYGMIHTTTERGKVIYHASQGRVLEGDPHYMHLRTELRVDDNSIYGVLVDETRGIERRIKEGGKTGDSVPDEIYDKIKDDLGKLGSELDKLYEAAGESQAWKKAKQYHEEATKWCSEHVKEILDR